MGVRCRVSGVGCQVSGVGCWGCGTSCSWSCNLLIQLIWGDFGSMFTVQHSANVGAYLSGAPRHSPVQLGPQQRNLEHCGPCRWWTVVNGVNLNVERKIVALGRPVDSF